MTKSRFQFSFLIVLFALLLGSIPTYATHNKAGEITFERVGDPLNYEYEITLTTYTDSRSTEAHRDEVEIFFGHGNPGSEESAVVPCAFSQCQINVASYTWRNQYRARHKFPGPGTCYTLSFSDPNRVSNIVNINDSFSVNIPFYVETQLCIYDDLGITSNNSPLLLEMPISFACINQRYEHNPNAFDVDGDSISYSLTIPKMGKNRPVTNYTSPERVPNGGGDFSLNPVTGELIWDSPKRLGMYSIAIKITEWRKVLGQNGDSYMRQIGHVVRDMQIIVSKCNNRPPIIREIKDRCVVAGSTVQLAIPISASDVDPEDIKLNASGGPLELVENKAEWVLLQSGNPATAEFRWSVKCEHIREQSYNVVISATDDGNGFFGQELTDLEHFNIKVIGPEPRNLRTEAIGQGIKLDWDAPVCDGVISYFIYRRVTESNWTPDDCQTGVPTSTGFKQIGIVDGDTYEFYDNRNGNGLFHGVSYCYRITALYKNKGQFSQSEGVSSEEQCNELQRDVPILTKASVLLTSDGTPTGQVEINWTSPIELDTIKNKPYYRFILTEAEGLNNGTPTVLIDKKFNTFKSILKDTLLISENLLTAKTPFHYQIDFFHFNEVTNQEELLGSAKSASTPWLKVKPDYQSLQLELDADVPWQNLRYEYYRFQKSTNDWLFLGQSTEPNYKDSGLINGRSYCYKVKTIGLFRDETISDSLINWSQENCGVPRDTIPPCPPTINAEALCDLFQNDLNWSFENDKCPEDIIKYYIYFQDRGIGDFVLSDSIDAGPEYLNHLDNRPELRRSLAGCYRVVAVDSFFNRSDSSNIVCVDNCPRYEIPNIFSPNGDGLNDSFLVMPGHRFIEKVSITVYNRWGLEVYSTTEPRISWDGNYTKNNKPLVSGTYYYVGEIEYIKLYKNQTRKVSGTITIIR